MKTSTFQLFLLLTSLLSACAQPPAASQAEVHPAALTAENRHPLYLSRDRGASWQELGQELPKEVNASFLDTIRGELVVATDNGGIFLSEKNMAKWKQIGQGLPGQKINALHISNGVIYAGVYSQGIFASKDLGESWINLNANLKDLRVQSICRWKGKLFIGTDSNICRWSEIEERWEILYEGVQVVSLEIYNNQLLAGTHLGTLLSDHQGEKWYFIHQAGSPHYTHVVDGNIVEMLVSGLLFISNNGGLSWYAVDYAPRAGTYVYEVVAIPGAWLMSNNYGIFRSRDGGIHWEHVFKTEAMGFLDLLAVGDVVIGGTREWDEYRKRE